MSGQSLFKLVYDKHAESYFSNIGWQATIVPKTRWYCDVIAHRNNEVAIIEVKSPAEGSCDKNFNDVGGLSPIVLKKFPPNFKGRRRFILTGIRNGPHIGLIKLYAATIGCQLFRYYKEYILDGQKRRQYRDSINNTHLPCDDDIKYKAFLVVPIEAKNQALSAICFLKQKKLVSNYNHKENCRLFVVEVSY